MTARLFTKRGLVTLHGLRDGFLDKRFIELSRGHDAKTLVISNCGKNAIYYNLWNTTWPSIRSLYYLDQYGSYTNHSQMLQFEQVCVPAGCDFLLDARLKRHLVTMTDTKRHDMRSLARENMSRFEQLNALWKSGDSTFCCTATYEIY